MFTQRIEIYPKTFEECISSEIDYDQNYVNYYIVSSQKRIPLEVLNDVFCNNIQSVIRLEVFEDSSEYDYVLDVAFLKGVTDNIANTTRDALALFDFSATVSSGKLFFLNTSMKKENILSEAKQVVYNPLIHKVNITSRDEFINGNRFEVSQQVELNNEMSNEVEVVSLDISDSELEKLSSSRCLALTLVEMHAIKEYYLSSASSRLDKGMPIWPTDVELECLAQTWSEHCKHKIFNAEIDFSNNITGESSNINSVFKSYVRNTTETIARQDSVDWLISVFHDNAGIVRFDKNIDLCFKVETHNSPSALDPYGGALTGILGVNRDILGCGIGAKPIANTNVFCLGAPGLFNQLPNDKKPKDLISPQDILSGIHKGVEDGGNKSGVPTINGAMSFHDSYSGKPLVYVGSLGYMPQKINGRDTHIKEIIDKDFIYVAGGRVGSDGIHGATFSSMDLNEDSPTNAVQIGDPITQKRLMDFLLEARDLGLITAITDNGAGGISSSLGEMAELSNGASVHLDRVPLKYSGLRPWEVLVSESQERMSFAISSKNSKAFEELAQNRGVEVANIGTFENTGNFDVYANSELCASLPLKFLHDGLPAMKLKATWNGPTSYHNPFGQTLDSKSASYNLETLLKKVISHGDIASKEQWIRKYDHEVGGNTSVRPLEKKVNSAPNNSGVLSLEKLGGEKGNAVALGLGMASRVSPHDPYLMAKMSVDESIRNIICHGANPDYIAILDNFCWPDSIESTSNPGGEEKLAQLVLACQGLQDSALAYNTPLISGKDSMKNDYRGKNNSLEDIKVSVLPTLLVSSMGKTSLDDLVPSSIQSPGHEIYLIGNTDGGMIGSVFAELFNHEKDLPVCDLSLNKLVFKSIHKLIKSKLISHCADISDGGMITALSEQLFLNNLGIDLCDKFTLEELFNESGGRFIISVDSQNKEQALNLLNDIPFKYLGKARDGFSIMHDGEEVDLETIYDSWNSGVMNFHKELSYEC